MCEELRTRQSSDPKSMNELIDTLYIAVRVAPAILTLLKALWDATVVPILPASSYASLSDWLHNSPEGQDAQARMDARALAEWLKCNLFSINDLIVKFRGRPLGPSTGVCICFDPVTCCRVGDNCPDESPITKRLAQSPRHDPAFDMLERRALPKYRWAGTRPANAPLDAGQAFSGEFEGQDVNDMDANILLAGWLTDLIVSRAFRIPFYRPDMGSSLCDGRRRRLSGYNLENYSNMFKVGFCGLHSFFVCVVPTGFACGRNHETNFIADLTWSNF